MGNYRKVHPIRKGAIGKKRILRTTKFDPSVFYFIIFCAVILMLVYYYNGSIHLTGQASGVRPTQKKCYDSDHGRNYSISGSCYTTATEQGRIADACTDSRLTEMYCDAAGQCISEQHTCPGLCRNGACI